MVDISNIEKKKVPKDEISTLAGRRNKEQRETVRDSVLSLSLPSPPAPSDDELISTDPQLVSI